MTRYLIVFRSHHEEPADIHCVDAVASSPLLAIRDAVKSHPPLHSWVVARAWPWPKGCAGVVEAAEKLTGTSRYR